MLVQQLIVLLEEQVTLDRLVLVFGEFVSMGGLEVANHRGEGARTAEVLQLVHKSIDGNRMRNLLEVAPDSIHVELVLLLLRLGLH